MSSSAGVYLGDLESTCELLNLTSLSLLSCKLVVQIQSEYFNRFSIANLSTTLGEYKKILYYHCNAKIRD